MAKLEATAPPPSAISYLVGALLHPRATFAQLGALPRKTWWVVFLILAALVAAPRYLSDQKQQALALQNFGAAQGAPGGFGAAPAPVVMGEPGGPSGPIDSSAGFAPQPSATSSVISAVGGVLGLPVQWLLMTIGITLVLIIVGGRSGFGDIFKVLLTASVPLAVRGLVQLGYVLWLGQPLGQAGLSGLLTSTASAIAIAPGAGPALPPAPPGFGGLVLASLLGQIDIFQVWVLVLVVIGIGVVAQVKPVKAALAVLIIWLLVGVLYALPSAALGAFAT